jgi:alginate O-acetyltransferase complex protein AlgI
LIFRGLFKKVVISSFLATQIVDPVFADPSGFSSLDVLFAIYAYSIVIYSDFSGYTDIAIGVAELLGFEFPHNFDRPYIARSLQDFWRRWHITLSRWLRDYLYIPLGGSRTTSERVYFNIMLTMLLGGLWHGAGWTFIIWGAIHGLGQAIGHFRRSRRERSGKQSTDGALVQVRQILITFHIVSFAWIFFRADSLGQAWEVISSLVNNFGTPELLTVWIATIVVGALAAQFIGSVPRLAEPISAGWRAFGSSSPVIQGTVGAVALFTITTLGPEGVAPFIYFRF